MNRHPYKALLVDHQIQDIMWLLLDQEGERSVKTGLRAWQSSRKIVVWAVREQAWVAQFVEEAPIAVVLLHELLKATTCQESHETGGAVKGSRVMAQTGSYEVCVADSEAVVLEELAVRSFASLAAKAASLEHGLGAAQCLDANGVGS